VTTLRAERPGFDSCSDSDSGSGTHSASIQWVPGAISQGVKRSEREADHPPPSSAEVKNAWSYTSAVPHVFMLWCFAKHRANFTFNFGYGTMTVFCQHGGKKKGV